MIYSDFEKDIQNWFKEYETPEPESINQDTLFNQKDLQVPEVYNPLSHINCETDETSLERLINKSK